MISYSSLLNVSKDENEIKEDLEKYGVRISRIAMDKLQIPGPYNTIVDRKPVLGDYILSRTYNGGWMWNSYGKIIGFDKDKKKEIIELQDSTGISKPGLNFSYERKEYVIIEQDKSKTVRTPKCEIIEKFNNMSIENYPPEVGSKVISRVHIGWEREIVDRIGKIISLDEKNKKAIIKFNGGQDTLKNGGYEDYVLSYEDFLVAKDKSDKLSEEVSVRKLSQEEVLAAEDKVKKISEELSVKKLVNEVENYNILRLSRYDIAQLLWCGITCIMIFPYVFFAKKIWYTSIYGIMLISFTKSIYLNLFISSLWYVSAVGSYVICYHMLADLVKGILIPTIYNKFKDEGNSVSNVESLDLTVLEDTNGQEVIETYECNGRKYTSRSGISDKLKNEDIKLPGHYDKIVSDVPNVGDNVVTRISFIDYGKILNGNVNMPTYNEFPQNAQGHVIRVDKETKRAYIEFESGFKREFSYKHKEFVVFKQDLSLKKPKLQDHEISNMSIGSDKKVTVKNRNPKVGDKVITRIRAEWNKPGSMGNLLNLNENYKLAFIKLDNEKLISLHYDDFAIIKIKKLKREEKLGIYEINIPENFKKNKKVLIERPLLCDDVITRVSCGEYPSNTLGKVIDTKDEDDEIVIEIKKTQFILKCTEVAVIR